MRTAFQRILLLALLMGCQPSPNTREVTPLATPSKRYENSPMVFSAKTHYSYDVFALGALLPVGRIELQVLEFQPSETGVGLTVELTGVAAEIFHNRQVWPVLIDEQGISVEGKPFLPHQASIGESWKCINGQAALIATEEVAVPVGLFPNCWKVVYLEPNKDPCFFWFSLGRGLVRAEFSSPMGRLMAIATQMTP